MKLRKIIICIFLLSLPVLGISRNKDCSDLISIQSSLPQPLVDIASNTAKAYFKNLNRDYFEYEPNQSLKIFLCMNVSDARNLIENHGNLTEAGDSFHVPSMNALYTYLTEDADDKISWDPIFKGIAEYLVGKRFPDAPLWFRYGLTQCLSKNAQVNEDEIVLSGPCPQASILLLHEKEQGTSLIVKKLFVLTDEGFQTRWPAGRPFSRMLFCWLHQTGRLKEFIVLAYNDGCELKTLEKAVSDMSAAKINRELANFISNECAVIANLAKAEQADDFRQKEALLQEIINSIPDNSQARLALARLYYKNGKKLHCRQILEPLLIRDDKICYMTAAKLAAACLYDSGKYADALKYYQKVWDRSDYYYYKYQLAYKIANCYHYLDKPKKAAKWYSEFLALNWFAKDDSKPVEYAEEYIERFFNSKF